MTLNHVSYIIIKQMLCCTLILECVAEASVSCGHKSHCVVPTLYMKLLNESIIEIDTEHFPSLWYYLFVFVTFYNKLLCIWFFFNS